jgi:hypothetical protein
MTTHYRCTVVATAAVVVVATAAVVVVATAAVTVVTVVTAVVVTVVTAAVVVTVVTAAAAVENVVIVVSHSHCSIPEHLQDANCSAISKGNSKSSGCVARNALVARHTGLQGTFSGSACSHMSLLVTFVCVLWAICAQA